MQRSEMTFNKGAILRKEMLTDLYEYPRVAIESYYASYTDGILYGLEWSENKQKQGHHVIMPGALKFHGFIYFLADMIDVEDSLNGLKLDEKYRLFFVERDVEIKEPSRILYVLDLVAVQSDRLEETKKKGFYYTYVECMSNNEFLVIEDKKEAYGLFAANDGYKFKLPSYLVKNKLSTIIEEKREKHPLDYEFLKNIYSNEGISVSMAKLYLNEYCNEYSENNEYIEKITNNPIELVEYLKKACSLLKTKTAISVNTEKVSVSNDCRDTDKVRVQSQGSL